MGSEIKLSHKSDGTPYVQLYLGRSPITGRAHRPYREFPGMTDAEATEAARVWRDSISSTYESGSLRVGAALGEYIEQLEVRDRSYNTIKTYRLYARRYAGQIERMQVVRVTPMLLNQLFKELRLHGPKGGRPLSNNTVRKFREFLKGAFGYFVDLGIIESNPVTATLAIPATKIDAHALEPADVKALRGQIERTLSETPDTKQGIMRRNAALAMHLALFTGARAGEICAIRRRDVDLAHSLISINGNVIERDREAIRQPRTKGKRTRRVSIDGATAEALRDHMEWQDGYLEHTGRNTPICTVNGSYMAPGTLSDQFRRYRRLLRLDPLATFHSLRHTHATMLLQGGTELHTVSERLGHAQPSTTLNTYAHVLEGRDRAAADMFGRLIEGE